MQHGPLLLVGSVGTGGAVGEVTLAALLAVGLAAMGALGAASDRPGASPGLGGVALLWSSTTTRAPNTA